MNDQRANQPAAQNLAARRSCGKPFGGGLGTEGRLPFAGQPPDIPRCGLSFGPAHGRTPRLNARGWPRDRRIAARQSRLNTTDASQPVMTAIMAVTTP
jgi:hypothetical protein